MSFTKHAYRERYKLFLSSLVASAGFLIAFVANAVYQHHSERESYLLMRHAIKVEAESNAHILQTAFRKYSKEGLVLQQFNTSVVAQMLYSPAFLKFSNSDEIGLLSSYHRDVSLANRYRDKAESFILDDKYEGKGKLWLENLKPVWLDNLDACEREIKLVTAQL